MGKRLGAAFIIYGIINLLASFAFLAGGSALGLAGIVWSIIIIAIGAWMRRRAKAQEHRDSQMDKQTELLDRMTKKLDEKEREKGV